MLKNMKVVELNHSIPFPVREFWIPCAKPLSPRPYHEVMASVNLHKKFTQVKLNLDFFFPHGFKKYKWVG